MPATAACTFPWALSATGVGYNLPGVKKLNLTGSILAGIYFGKITKWNDAKIKKVNPGVKLPGLPITPVFRSDGSGDTYAITNYLSKVSCAWKNEVGYATTVGFNHGIGAKGNSGVTATVVKTPGAIGYISAYYLMPPASTPPRSRTRRASTSSRTSPTSRARPRP